MFLYGDSNCGYGLTVAAKAQVTEWSSKNFIELKKVGCSRAPLSSSFPRLWLAVISPNEGHFIHAFFSCLGKPHPVLCILTPCVPQLLGITFMALPQEVLGGNSLTAPKPTLRSPKPLPVVFPGFLRIPNLVISGSFQTDILSSQVVFPPFLILALSL